MGRPSAGRHEELGGSDRSGSRGRTAAGDRCLLRRADQRLRVEAGVPDVRAASCATPSGSDVLTMRRLNVVASVVKICFFYIDVHRHLQSVLESKLGGLAERSRARRNVVATEDRLMTILN